MKSINAKDKLLEASVNLLVGQGYLVTTVDQLCETAGVSKGSFYHYYETKEDLGLEVLRFYYQQGSTALMSGPFRDEPDPRRRAEGFLAHTESISEEIWKNGCLLGNFAMDLADTHPRIRRQLSELFDDLIHGLSAVFEPFAGNGVRAEDIAEQYLAVIEGSIVLARAYGDPARIPKALRQFRFYLTGVQQA